MGALLYVVKPRVRRIAGSPYASAVPVDYVPVDYTALDYTALDYMMLDYTKVGCTKVGCTKEQERVYSGYRELSWSSTNPAEAPGRTHNEEDTLP
jgi:hypothetical protein